MKTKLLKISQSVILWQGNTCYLTSEFHSPASCPVKSCLCIAARWQLWCPPVRLPGEARWRCCWVNSLSCTFIVLSTGLKLSCWFVAYEGVETVGSLCSGDTALLSYSWWFSFMLLAFCTTCAAVSQANESWHPDWLLHVQHGAIKKGMKGLVGVLLCPGEQMWI